MLLMARGVTATFAVVRPELLVLRGGIDDDESSSGLGGYPDRDVCHAKDATPMRAIYRDGEGGLGSGLGVDSAVGEENGSSADADTGFAAKEQTLPAPPKLRKGKWAHTGGGPEESVRRPLKAKYRDVSDERVAFCMMLDDLTRERRSAVSKRRHMNSRSRRLAETGSLNKKPLGSRRRQQGATAAAADAADGEVEAICYHLLKDTKSSADNADLSPVFGRKWYKTDEGLKYLEDKRKLDEFASANKFNEIFALQWGCLPEELQQVTKAARTYLRRECKDYAVSDTTPESSEDVSHALQAPCGGDTPLSMHTHTHLNTHTQSSTSHTITHAMHNTSSDDADRYVPRILQRLLDTLDHELELEKEWEAAQKADDSDEASEGKERGLVEKRGDALSTSEGHRSSSSREDKASHPRKPTKREASILKYTRMKEMIEEMEANPNLECALERARKHNIFPELEKIFQRPDETGRGEDDGDDDYVVVEGTEKGAEKKVIRLDLTGPGSVGMEYFDACLPKNM
jgi:hypothetical protein